MPDTKLEEKFALLQSQIEGGRAWEISDSAKPDYFASIYLSDYRGTDIRNAAQQAGLTEKVIVTEAKGHARLSTLYVSHEITDGEIETLASAIEKISGVRKDHHQTQQMVSGKNRQKNVETPSLPRRS